jgi:cephalosporin-C deacetylase-like acetyl esterase
MLVATSACAQTFEELTEVYRYDRAASLNVQEKEMERRAGYKLSSVQFDLPKGGQRSGFLVSPDAPGRKPAVVWMHSSGAMQFLGDAVLMARAGAVSLLVEAGGLQGESPEQTRDALIADVIALRRAVDLLETRSDVDSSRLALVGHSYGAMISTVAASIDNRFRAAVFEVGLLGMSIHIATSPHPWAQGVRKALGNDLPHFLEVISVVDGKHYIAHAPSIPKLFQSAWYDPGVPHKDAQDFFDAATGPKELKWYDTGHDIDDIAAQADRARFLGRCLHLRGIEQALREKVGRR